MDRVLAIRRVAFIERISHVESSGRDGKVRSVKWNFTCLEERSLGASGAVTGRDATTDCFLHPFLPEWLQSSEYGEEYCLVKSDN